MNSEVDNKPKSSKGANNSESYEPNFVSKANGCCAQAFTAKAVVSRTNSRLPGEYDSMVVSIQAALLAVRIADRTPYVLHHGRVRHLCLSTFKRAGRDNPETGRRRQLDYHRSNSLQYF